MTAESLQNRAAGFEDLRSGIQPKGSDPYPLFRRLRRHAPVWRSPWSDWYLSSYDAVAGVFLHPDCLQSPLGDRDRVEAPDPPADPVATLFRDWLFFANAPDHAALRRAMLPVFSGQSFRELEPDIRAICHALIPDGEEGTCAFIKTMARPLPIAVISKIVGLPEADQSLAAKWASIIRVVLDIGLAAVDASTRDALHDMREYFLSLTSDPVWRRCTGSGNLGDLVAKFPNEVVAANLALLVFTGHETTMHLIGSMMLNLAQRPADWQRLRRDPMLVPNVVNEVLRFESPVQKICRQTNADIEIAGTLIPRGQLLVLLLGAANRDPAQYPDPDAFDINRRDRRHLAFGLGHHLCVGQALAQLEAKIVLRALLARWPTIAPAPDGWSWGNNASFRGLEKLDLQWSAAA